MTRPYGAGHGKGCGHSACMSKWCRPSRTPRATSKVGWRAARLKSAKKSERRDARAAIEMEVEMENLLKVIFLDIDGVLNWAGTEHRAGPFVGLDPAHIERFNRILDAHPDAKIVVSSTWRHSRIPGVYEDFEGLKKLLAAHGLRGEIIDRTPTKFSYVSRGGEIRMWIEDWQERNPGKSLTFVILDDTNEGMEGYTSGGYGEAPYETLDLRKHHVMTFWLGDKLTHDLDEEGGLQDRHVAEAIRVLNGWKDS